VKGLWRTKRHREFFDQLVFDLEEIGFETTSRLMNSIEFAVPQDRDRIFLFGARRNFLRKNGLKIHEFDWTRETKYSRDTAFGYDWPDRSKFGKHPIMPDAPEELMVEYWFSKNKVREHPNAGHCFKPRAALPRFQTIDEGDDSKKSFKRLHRYRFSPTACYGNNEVHLHPYEARRLNVAETLAIQSLPIDFELPPTMSLSAMFKTIGNGVPFLMAQGIARSVDVFLRR
jgi:DNA (cytosine-5)-methyltransferase 1